MLGDIVKVTPSSKMVGDLAIFMVQNRPHAREHSSKRARPSTFPDSVVIALLQGHDGSAGGRLPGETPEAGAQGRGPPITCRPGALLPPVRLRRHARKTVEQFRAGTAKAPHRAVISGALYPKVVEDDCRQPAEEYGYMSDAWAAVYFLPRHGTRARPMRGQHWKKKARRWSLSYLGSYGR